MPRRFAPIRFAATLAGLSIAGALVLQPASAAIVTGTYLAPVSADSNLGLIGKTMRVDFSYDDTATPDTEAAGTALYNSFLTSLSITIDGNVWTWDSANGTAALIVYNNASLGFGGAEDRINVFADTFNGPSLVGQPVAASAYAFALYMDDFTPAGDPDGVGATSPLASTPADPAAFSGGMKEMGFSFFVGDPELGTRYAVLTSTITAPPIPEPGTTALMAAGLALLGAGALRRSRKS